MFDHARPRLAAVVAFLGGAVVLAGLDVPWPAALPSWAWFVAGGVCLGAALGWAWPRKGDEERLIREAQERLIRERARDPLKEEAQKASAPGKQSASSPKWMTKPHHTELKGAELEKVRGQLRTVQRSMQEAAVRLGLDQLSREGYMARVEELKTQRADLEAKLIDLERRAIGRS